MDDEYGLRWIYSRTKGVRIQLFIYTVFILCIPILQLQFSYYMKLFIDIATGTVTLGFINVALRTITVVAAGGILMMINAVLSKWIYGKLECGLRSELLDIVFSRRMLEISKQHTGEILTKLTTDVQAVCSCFPAIIENMIGGLGSAIFATTVLFFLNWKIALILIILIPVLMVFMSAFTPKIQETSAIDKRNHEINCSLIQESLGRITLIKAYFLQKKTINKIKNA